MNRTELVEARTAELLSGRLERPDNYNPFSSYNMHEFMQEIGDDWVNRLCDLAIDSELALSVNKDWTEQRLGALFISYAVQYWTELASARAEVDVPEDEEEML